MYSKQKKECRFLKDGSSAVIAFKDLPKKLQQKYRNSVLFESDPNRSQKNRLQIDKQKLKQRKIDKSKTLEQKLEEYTINPTQQKYLMLVFEKLKNPNQKCKHPDQESFGKKQLINVLKKLQIQINNSEIELMIWEFDEDLDKKISRKEFIAMYKKCMMDSAAAQPKKLFHLTQFLMYCQPDKYRISVQDALELLYVRAQSQAQQTNSRVNGIFEESIKIIFGQDYEKDRNQVEMEISFAQYLQKINKKAIQKRRQQIQRLKAQLRY